MNLKGGPVVVDIPKENNWITTRDGRPFFVMFRLYGPQKPIVDKTWVLNDIEKVGP
jgi:hypothetical protein